ncbi:hypothetical protein JVU11DRAFT_3902 [Chiua virens]|nr:hypothetical protein JVU11DRAFT_3902 [Chiua virens]
MVVLLGRDKELPGIPVKPDPSRSSAEFKGLNSRTTYYLHPKSHPSADTNKALPPINVEETLSVEQLDRLYEIWNEAGLTARAHRKRYRSQNAPRRAPAPIAIPDRQGMALSSPPDPSVKGDVSRTETSRKRWGVPWPSSVAQEVEKKTGALQVLRTMAQDRLKRKIRCAKSTPNLTERVTRPSVTAPMCVVTVPKDGDASGSSIQPSSRKSATTMPPEDLDADGIYFTLDPNSRFSQDSVRFQPITPIPGSTTAFGRPDSPLLHRHYSLDQLAFSAQEAARMSAMELPLEHAGDEVVRLIDEVQAYLES